MDPTQQRERDEAREYAESLRMLARARLDDPREIQPMPWEKD